MTCVRRGWVERMGCKMARWGLGKCEGEGVGRWLRLEGGK